MAPKLLALNLTGAEAAGVCCTITGALGLSIYVPRIRTVVEGYYRLNFERLLPTSDRRGIHAWKPRPHVELKFG